MPLRGGRKKLSEVPGEGGYQILKRCVTEAMMAGTLRQDDPDRVSLFFWTRVHGIVMLLLACDLSESVEGSQAPEPLELFRDTQSFVVDGLRA